MVTIVVIFNLIIAAILLYVARRVWLIRLKLRRINNKLIAIERGIQVALSSTPNAIYRGQMGIYQLKQGNEPLQLQIQRMRQVLSLLTIGQQTWQRFFLASSPFNARLTRAAKLFRK